MSERPSEGPGPGDRVRRGRIRRSPRYSVFVTAGVVVGLVAAVVLTFSRPETEYSYGAVLGYLVVLLAPVGAILGGLAAVLAGRRR